MRKSKAVAPKKGTLNKVRSAARKQGKSSLSMREIDKEIKAYRRELKASPADANYGRGAGGPSQSS